MSLADFLKSDEYQQLRVIIHNLAYKAQTIWEKATTDERRIELSEIFTNLAQDRLILKPKYTLAAEYLANWIPKLNSDYELQKTQSIKGKEAVLAAPHSNWLPGRDSDPDTMDQNHVSYR